MPPIYNRIVETGKDKESLINFIEKCDYKYTSQRITTAGDLEFSIKNLIKEGVNCLIYNLKHWERNALMVQLARRMDLTLALYCHTRTV